MKSLPLVALLALLLFAACAPPAIAIRWDDPATLSVPSDASHREWGAVVLRHERKIMMVKHWFEDSFTQAMDHVVLAILDRSGQGHANVSVHYRSDWKIKGFRARTIAPDHSVHEVEPESIFEDTSREKAGDDEGWKVRVYAFPQVEAGAILEYQYVIEYPYVTTWYWEYCVDDVPVKQYDLTLMVSKDASCLLKAYNTSQDIVKSEDGDFTVMKWSMKDLLPARDEAWTPHKQFTNPWWAMSIVQMHFRRQVFDVSTRWEHALKRIHERLVREPGKDLKDFKSPIARVEGEARLATIDRAFTWARDVLRNDDWQDFDDQRPLATVVGTGRAGNFERARLLQRMLAEAGVRADVALLRRWQTGVFDRDVPSAVWFNHMVVVVPKQDGVPERTWLDPSCLFCGPGKLPAWDRDTEAVVVSMDPARAADGLPTWELAKPAGSPAGLDAVQRSFKLDVDARGEVTGVIEVEMLGAEGQDWARSHRDETAREKRRHFRNLAAAYIPGGSLVTFEEHLGSGPLDKTRYVLRLKSSRLAAVRGDEILLPLDFVFHSYEARPWPEKRTLPLVVREGEEFSEDVTVHGPSGMTLRVEPRKGAFASGVASAEFRVESDGGTVHALRTLALKRGQWTQAQYQDFRKAVDVLAQVKRIAVAWGR